MKLVWQAIGGRSATCTSTQSMERRLRVLAQVSGAVSLRGRAMCGGRASSADLRRRFKGYVVGMKLPPSGLFALSKDGTWEQRGYNHPYITAMDYDRRHPQVIYLAAGNGCIRSADTGKTWRILTSWGETELQDIAVDRHHPGTIFIALPDGIAKTTDEGRTWQRAQAGIERKYTKALRVDRENSGRVIAGTERGIFLSTDNGAHWLAAERAAEMVTHIEQSPHKAGEWLATTERSGLWRSKDRGDSWQRVRGVPSDKTLYQVSYHPSLDEVIAVCGWGIGVLISRDGGATFHSANYGLPAEAIWSVRFDPTSRNVSMREYTRKVFSFLKTPDSSGGASEWMAPSSPTCSLFRRPRDETRSPLMDRRDAGTSR